MMRRVAMVFTGGLVLSGVAFLQAQVERGPGERFSIPVEVFEARRFASPGADRVNEGLSVGIPFPDDLQVKETAGRPALALEGADRYQFRTLAKWPSGNVRWAAVVFQTDCQAGGKATGFSVVPGTGVSPGKPLATETDEKIFIDTGPLRASIRKKGFNLFESVAVEGRPVLKPGSADVVVTGADGTRYLASADGTAVLEENGPVRAVVKAVGSHRDPRGKRMLGYIVRLYFYRGRTDVKLYHTLTNDEARENPTKVTIEGLDLVLPLASRPLRARLGRHGPDPLALNLQGAGGELTCYMARPRGDFRLGSGKEDMTWEEHGVRPGDTGYWIKLGGKELVRGSAKECPDLMWLDTADKDGAGVTVGIRFARGDFPKALRLAPDGALSVGLYPAENGIGHLIAHGSHRTFQVLLDFHAAPATDPAGATYRFQYPLCGRTTVEWYNRCTGYTEVHPLYHFVSRREEEEFAERMGWTNRQANRRTPMVVWRAWYWGRGGFRNQHDFARIALVNFLRDDDIRRAGEYFLYAEDRFNYNVDWSIHHGRGRTDFGRRNYIGRKINFEEEHRHWYGIPLFYYTTGDQRIGDAIRPYLYKRLADCSSARMYGWTRFFGWAMWLLAGGYDYTGDDAFREGIRKHLGTVLGGKKWPMDWNRGVFGEGDRDWPGLPPGKPYLHHAPGLMVGYIIHDSFWNARRQFAFDDPTGSRLADICEGIEWFIARECYLRKGDLLFIPYQYNLNGEPLVLNPGLYTPGQTFYALLLPALLNGEEYAPGILEGVVRSAYAHRLREDGFTYLDHPGCQAALYYLIHQKAELAGAPPEAVHDLEVEALGGGKVKLSWTTPDRALRLQARYAPRRMVPNLDYDNRKRRYRFPPERFSNWWAAEHLFGEPKAQPGRRQAFVASEIPPGTYYFAVRAWDAKHHRSAISNQVRVEVR